MKGTRNLTVLIIVGLILILGMWSCSGYNGLVKQDETVKNKWNDVQSSYQRRGDLIPNLVATVKGVANFEKSTLVDVTNARAKATSIQVDPNKLTPENVQKFQSAQGELSGALSRLLVASERYPELKATENFSGLQAQLEGTENRISVARNDFNDAVTKYNTKIKQFPTSFIARMGGFTEKGYFQADAAAANAPKVQF